jgi:hypothetical protein
MTPIPTTVRRFVRSMNSVSDLRLIRLLGHGRRDARHDGIAQLRV